MQTEQSRETMERSHSYNGTCVQDVCSQGSKKLTTYWKTEWDKKEFENWKEEAIENKSVPRCDLHSNHLHLLETVFSPQFTRIF